MACGNAGHAPLRPRGSFCNGWKLTKCNNHLQSNLRRYQAVVNSQHILERKGSPTNAQNEINKSPATHSSTKKRRDLPSFTRSRSLLGTKRRYRLNRRTHKHTEIDTKGQVRVRSPSQHRKHISPVTLHRADLTPVSML